MSLSIGIRGAGAAGLSLARALLNRLPSAEISIFDKRERLPHPKRTFCFFADSRSFCTLSTTHSWRKISFSGQGFQRTIECDATPYSFIPGDVFFSTALQDLESRGVQFHWGCTNPEILKRQIITPRTTQTFDFVIDAAFDPDSHRAILWQSFAGLWVKAQHDIFNPEEAVLMDLGASDYTSPVSFVYLLPTSANTALIEHTSFSRKPMPRQWHLDECRKWIARKGLLGISEYDTEHGAIPMGLASDEITSANLRVGSIGGAIRAGTGFAFQAIQAQVEDMARRIESSSTSNKLQRVKQPVPFPAWSRLCDSLFLQALSRAPESGDMIMGQLLRRAPARDLIPFLSGKASFSQALHVMLKVPKITMLRALCFGS